MALDPGLIFVATPIGRADDITLHALRVLREADVLAAEDTRRLRQLMEIHGVPLAGRRVVAYHDRNGAEARPGLLAALRAGKSVAYASDAGTPLVADPGYRLAQEAIAEGLPVTSAPGASSVLTALVMSGLPSDRFLFLGFPPPKSAARRRWFGDVASVPATLVVFEAARRLAATLGDMNASLGARDVAICRELTKRFEEVKRGSLADLAAQIVDAPKGEVVIVIGPPKAEAERGESLDDALRAALDQMSVKDAVAAVAETTGAPRREVYARALELGREH